MTGDRVLGIDGVPTDGILPQTITSILLGDPPRKQLTLDVEFNVADAVVPTTGVFAVKIHKLGGVLGITLTSKFKSKI